MPPTLSDADMYAAAIKQLEAAQFALISAMALLEAASEAEMGDLAYDHCSAALQDTLIALQLTAVVHGDPANDN